MYLMYVDESGDVGQRNSTTKFFILSAIFVHEAKWLQLMSDLNDFRRGLKTKYGLLKREEIHSSVFVKTSGNLRNSISRANRINILTDCIDWMAKRNDIVIITIRNDKMSQSQGAAIFDFTWQILLQRFDNTMYFKNFPMINPSPISNPSEFYRDQKGIIMSDNTDGGKLKKLIRKMRYQNYVPLLGGAMSSGSQNLPVKYIIEDHIMRDSQFSYLHQMVDVVAYFAKQLYQPNYYLKSIGLDKYYGILMPVIHQSATKSSTQFKIVEI